MTIFIRALEDADKKSALLSAIAGDKNRTFNVDPTSFRKVPGSPFSYWATEGIRDIFSEHAQLESGGRIVRQGLSTSDDFRFCRCWWEIDELHEATTNCESQVEGIQARRWHPLLKGGSRSAFVTNFDLVLNYFDDGRELKAWVSAIYNNAGWSRDIKSTDYYFRRGFSWSLRSSKFSPSIVPDGCIFSASRYQAFTSDEELSWVIALLNSTVVTYLLRMCSERFEHPKYVVGIVSKLPLPCTTEAQQRELSAIFERAVSLKRDLLSLDETSHFFRLPSVIGNSINTGLCVEGLDRAVEDIDTISAEVYRLSDSDALIIQSLPTLANPAEPTIPDRESDEDDENIDDKSSDSLFSWCVGVGFGRFDWRLATGKRAAPPEPDPFDPLPVLSPGMLPVGAAPFHAHDGILVDDPGHEHDLVRLVDDVLGDVGQAVPDDLRRWLQREFFAFHLQRYSKSRRKAPIYWPLATASGSYTLWLYYPSLGSQTLYSAINDFLDGPNGKLTQVAGDVVALRNKGAGRTRDEERRFETLGAFELELIELRDTLLKIAPTFKPNHDDGVQITAAPLWPLFRHKPWQKVLKDTWAKLEKGDYDWAHLAMNYWPERVREKCKTDKSLAIAHGLEHLYIEPAAQPKKTRAKKSQG